MVVSAIGHGSLITTASNASGHSKQLFSLTACPVSALARDNDLLVASHCAGEEPELAEDVWFGAFTCLDLEDRFARAMLERWGADEEHQEEVA